MIKLFDSYKKKLVEITPTDNYFKMYSCGPTVYQYQHIGNLRAAWLPDTVAKVAKLNGINVSWVLNITDVGHLVGDGDEGEDKIEKGAKTEGKKVEEIINFYTEDYLKQASSINLDIPKDKNLPKATDYIIGQMKLALELVSQGRAYILNDGIYFEASANLDLEVPFDLNKSGDSTFTGREIHNSDRQPGDFALWKFVPENTLQKWRFNHFDETANDVLRVLQKLNDPDLFNLPNRWGVPGWHSECVVMNKEIHGDGINSLDKHTSVIDVHFGGEDHIDIHHRNEILQSEALGFHLSKYWVHNKFVLVDGTKMSKSLGNVYTIVGEKKNTGFESIQEKGFDPLSYRMMLMEHHYTVQLDFTWDKLEQSQARLYNMRKEIAKILSLAKTESIEIDKKFVKPNQPVLIDILNNNLDCPKFLEMFNDLVKTTIENGVITKDKLMDILFWENNFLKMDLIPQIPSEIYKLGDQRDRAKKAKDFETSDSIRDLINQKGYQIDDYSWGFGFWKK